VLVISHPVNIVGAIGAIYQARLAYACTAPNVDYLHVAEYPLVLLIPVVLPYLLNQAVKPYQLGVMLIYLTVQLAVKNHFIQFGEVSPCPLTFYRQFAPFLESAVYLRAVLLVVLPFALLGDVVTVLLCRSPCFFDVSGRESSFDGREAYRSFIVYV
jgi:hypothetical protein